MHINTTSSNKVCFFQQPGALHQRKCEFSQRLKEWFRSITLTSERTGDRAKGDTVINYSCCMTVWVCMCKKCFSALKYSSGPQWQKTVCVRGEELYWVCVSVWVCTRQSVFLLWSITRSSVTGYTLYWISLLFWVCSCVCVSLHFPPCTDTDGSLPAWTWKGKHEICARLSSLSITFYHLITESSCNSIAKFNLPIHHHFHSVTL